MKALQFASAGERLSVLCLGAHSDDIEIGAGATLLSMIARDVRLEVQWCVLSGTGECEREARASAAELLLKAANAQIEIMTFKDGLFPQYGEAIKSWFEELKMRVDRALPQTASRSLSSAIHRTHNRFCR
jgi:LmbE family N-acetylglucosaminyl deacetylase